MIGKNIFTFIYDRLSNLLLFMKFLTLILYTEAILTYAYLQRNLHYFEIIVILLHILFSLSLSVTIPQSI